MGKKARTKRGEQRKQGRKLDKSIIPPPPPPVEDEVRRHIATFSLFRIAANISLFPFFSDRSVHLVFSRSQSPLGANTKCSTQMATTTAASVT